MPAEFGVLVNIIFLSANGIYGLNGINVEIILYLKVPNSFRPTIQRYTCNLWIQLFKKFMSFLTELKQLRAQ